MSPHVFGWILLPFGLAGLGWQLNKTRLSRATSKWNKVPCTVAGIDVVAQDSALSDEENFAVSARYTYEVDGKTLSATKVANRHCEFLTRDEVARLIDGLPESGPHHAYYNPADPRDAVLVTGSDMANVKETAIMLVLIASSVFLILRP
jgi:hypothetical protein